MKRILTCVLVVSLLICSIFVPATQMCVKAAEESEKQILCVTSDNASVKTAPSKNADVIAHVIAGTYLESNGYEVNSFGNVWYKTETEFGTGYIYSGNVNVSYDNNFGYVEVVADNVAIRNAANKYGQKMLALNSGDAFRLQGTYINASGNVWYKYYSNEEEVAYVYSGNCLSHNHQMEEYHDENGNLAFVICRCGFYCIPNDKSNVIPMSVGVMENPYTYLEVGSLIYESLAAGEALALSSPYVAVIVGVGALIYVSASLDQGVKVEIDKLEGVEAYDDSLKKRVHEGQFYFAGVKNGVFYLDMGNPMGINEASGVVSDMASRSLLIKKRTRLFDGIFTPMQYDAVDLCDNFEKEPVYLGGFRTYGGIKRIKGNDDKVITEIKIHEAEINPGEGMIFHYHLFQAMSRTTLDESSKLEFHVWFGAPSTTYIGQTVFGTF